MGIWEFIEDISMEPWEIKTRELNKIDARIDGIGCPPDPVGRRNYIQNTPIKKIEEDIETLKNYAEELRRKSKSHNEILGKVWNVESKIREMQLLICKINNDIEFSSKRILEEKIKEIESLKSNGTISEDEYKMMRSKALKKYMHEF